MAENKTININIKQNADKAEQSFKSYNKELGNTKKQYDAVLKSGKPFDQQLEDINRIVKETPLNVRDMNKQIQAYQSIALSAGRETPVGRKALEEAAALRDRYIDIQNETKRLADDQRTLEGAMQGVATGVAVYGGIQSAMALSGVESEKLRETLVKLQAAQTLMNSINQVATAFEKESALVLTAKSVKTKAVTAATAAYATVTGTTTGVLKAFRIALASTGIGLLVVGIGLLIANFEKVTKVIKMAIDVALKPIKAAIDAIVDAYYAVTDALGITSKAEREREKQSKINAANEKKRAAERRAEFKNLQEEIKRTIGEYKRLDASRQKSLDKEIALLKASGKETRNLERQKLVSVIDTETKILQERIKTLKASENAGNAWVKMQQKLILAKQVENAKEAEFQLTVFDAETNKKKADNYKNYANERLSASRKIQDLENSLLEDGIDKELKINQTRVQRLIEDTKKNTKLTREERNRLIALYEEQGQQKAEDIRAKYRQKEIDAERKLQQQLEADRNAFEDEIAAIQEANYQALLTDQERELLAVQDKYFRLQELAQGNADALNEIEIARLNEENEINLRYQNEQLENQKKLSEQEVAMNKSVQDSKLKFANDAFSAIGDLANAFAGESEKSQKRAFQINKAVGIAQAIVNTAGAVSAAINPAVGGLGIPAGLPGAILAAATGAAQVATIAKTKFQGGSTGDVSAPSESGLGAAVTPEFNVVGDSGVNQLAQLQQQPTQAYVVSGDVTSAQSLDRNRVQNATL